MNNGVKFPCLKCPDRYPGCHDKCEKYQEAKALHEHIKKKEKKAKQIEDGFIKTSKRIAKMKYNKKDREI